MRAAQLDGASPILRLWQPPPDVTHPDVPPPEPEPSLTLREAFETHLRGELAGGSRRTINEYLNALNHWERQTDNPPIDAITDQVVSDFRAAMIDNPGTGPRTINKTWKQLRPILRRCGPRQSNNPQGLGLIREVPYFKLVPTSKPQIRAGTMEEVDALYRACEVATWPLVKRTGSPAPAIWRAAIVAWWNCGPRCWDLWGTTDTKGWQWDKLKEGRIEFWVQKTHEFHMLDLHPLLIAHLDVIRAPRARIFPASGCQTRLYDEWRKIVAAAAVTRPSVADLLPHDLRRSCQTEWDDIRVGFGDFVLCHRPQGVGATWYRDVERRVRIATPKLPQPPAFEEIGKKDDQLRLF